MYKPHIEWQRRTTPWRVPFSRARVMLFLILFSGLMAASPGTLRAEPGTPPLGLDAYMPVPESNPLTPKKIALGRKLFFDPVLSRDSSLSCSTCHDPNAGFSDGNAVAVGIGGKRGTRRSARLINRGYGKSFFWDGRAATLEEQVLQPIQNPIEMGMTPESAVDLLRSDAGYAAFFQEAFGRPPDVESLRQALASYVRSIVSGNSPYDRFVAGDASALTPAQQQGLELFRGKADCAICHLGPNLSDEEFHNTGVGWKNGPPQDRGRAHVTNAASDTGAFKTPTLREIASSAPYMHDGGLATLADVVEFYDKGGEPNPYRSPEMRALHLTELEKSELIEFLKALSGEVREGN